MQYHWPGNIRELESTVSRAALSSPGRVIRPADIEFLHANETPAETSRDRLPSLADAERAHIARVLESVSWNKKQAAAVLEISRGTLYRRSWRRDGSGPQSVPKQNTVGPSTELLLIPALQRGQNQDTQPYP
jgi:transcriptional regulator of acetoin/glycerol metabolism